MYVKLVAQTEGLNKYEGLNQEEIISAIARHGIIKEDNGKLVKYLMDNKHFSPLDMVNFVFEVETKRSIGRQWLRHSSIKPQEHSQRYSDRVVFEDVELRLEHPSNRQSSTKAVGLIKVTENGANVSVTDEKYQLYADKGKELLKAIRSHYKEGYDLGIAKECLRDFLPECTTTTLTFNGTLRSWLSFLNVRLDNHSQKEIVELAKLVAEELAQKLPNVFKAIDYKNGLFM